MLEGRESTTVSFLLLLLSRESPVQITSRGQVTIPQEFRDRFGLLPHTEVEFVAVRNSLQIVKAVKTARPTRGRTLVSRLRGRATVRMSTDEILALTRK